MTATSSRKIGVVLATFVVANNMIGSGFFLLPASLAQSGSVTVFSWILGTFLAVVLGGAFARLARDYPNLESPDDYVRPALGRDMGFLATTLYWGSSWIGNNAIAVAAFGYLVTLLPLAGDSPSVQMYGQIVLIWLMFFLNLLGPKQIARFQSLCVVLGLAPVAVVLVGGWGTFDRSLFDAAWNTTGAEWNTAKTVAQSDFSVVFASLAPIFWAFVGLETGAMVAGIVHDPDRNVPRATLAGITIAGVVYVISSMLVMGIVPAPELAASSAPFALVAGRIFGDWAIPVIAAAAALKATGTLGGWMLVTGESGARAARRGYLPAFFGYLRPNGSAAWGLLFIASGMTLLAFLTLAPTVAEQFGFIINIVVLLVVLAYVAAALSLIVGTHSRPSGMKERLLGAGALIACALLIISSPLDMILGAAATALLAWIVFRVFVRRAG
jgi:arginine:agmatine antiporter